MVGETKEWLPELVTRAKALNVNGGFEKDSDLGPLISPQSKQRVEALIQSAIDEGADVLLDGRGYKPEKVSKRQLGLESSALFHRIVTKPILTNPPGRPNHNRQRKTAHEMLHGRDLRPRPRVPQRRNNRRSNQPDQRQRIRQRRRHLHQIRRHSHSLPEGDRSRPAGDQRPHPGPVAHVQLHGQQEECGGYRRKQFLREGWTALLHAVEDCYELLERGGCGRDGEECRYAYAFVSI